VNRSWRGKASIVAAAAVALGACGSSRPTLEDVAKPLAVFARQEAKAPGAAFYVRDPSRVLDPAGQPTTVEAVKRACAARSDRPRSPTSTVRAFAPACGSASLGSLRR